MPSERAATKGAMARRSWSEAFAVYLHPRVIGMLFLGFSAGLPFLLLFSTLSLWLRDAEVTRTAVGFFAWVGITFSIKVLWAPVVDHIPLPWLTAVLGKRRSWMLIGQLGIVTGLLAIAIINLQAVMVVSMVDGDVEMVAPDRFWIVAVALAALWIAFWSATQDVAIDAYRIEAAPDDLQGGMAATYQLGYRIGLLAAGAGALYIAEFWPWQTAYLVMAALMLIGIVTVLVIREPESTRPAGTILEEDHVVAFMAARDHLSLRQRRVLGWFYGAVGCPFGEFFRRNGKFALVILVFISVYRLSDITMGVMANVFYDDLGFSKLDIANVSKTFGIFVSIVGVMLGGVLVARYGIMRVLLLGAILVASTNLLFAYLAIHGKDIWLLAGTISADNLSAGIAGTAFIAYLSSLTNRHYTATQYALFSSLFTLFGKFVAGFSGVIVDAEGYVFFFVYASLLGIPAILLVLYLMNHQRRQDAALSTAEGPAREQSPQGNT
ncbi:MFS transporter [Pelagibius sp.]|uniref:AmpG family muropeptide MFS transporter n=1 Tax=Pelagibius sp. TaxID=1931238 RepID=UPI00261D697F|nr:MFS transporter [Pelagibius sp.]